MDIKDIIRQKRAERSLTLNDVAKAVGVSEATVCRWESGEIADMRRGKIVLLANVLGVSPSELMGWDGDQSADLSSSDIVFPVIGDIAAGYDHIAVEDWDGETVRMSAERLRGRKQDDYFVLRVKGNSMYPLYMDGDLVLVLKQSTVNASGDIGVVLYDDEMATLKKIEFKRGEDWLRLIPVNPEYMPKRVEGEELTHCRVIGIPKLILREV